MKSCWQIAVDERINEVDASHLHKLDSYRRRLFTPDEDKLIAEMVTSKKYSNWSQIASKLPGRSSRQVRDRWTNYLSPDNSLSPWNRSEDLKIVYLVNQIGTKWMTIAKCFDGRSDNSIKNRWYSTLKNMCSITSDGTYILEEDHSKVRRCRQAKKLAKPLINLDPEEQIPLLKKQLEMFDHVEQNLIENQTGSIVPIPINNNIEQKSVSSKATTPGISMDIHNIKSKAMKAIPHSGEGKAEMTTNKSQQSNEIRDVEMWDRQIEIQLYDLDQDPFKNLEFFENWF
ncbi:hypothetical protein TRFO_15774 [Tritrichomonas foetus]|uniref:Myb-like DNA-binding domain containing protein n=1 Tax=Tritrichomonas foetus TaxID=1144522 RepID=A0A1J4KS22_9EUKA|nr:hypothetical protein TRFO_15774 [Tritrichomonas foetus]|eukprot:OHT13898.1 hypothetical protein TRFO_15774 [Tritrichomonas foetus]